VLGRGTHDPYALLPTLDQKFFLVSDSDCLDIIKLYGNQWWNTTYTTPALKASMLFDIIQICIDMHIK
jgi:hypothetical protein